MLFYFTLLFANFKVKISIKGKLTLSLVPLSSSAGGREKALTGNGSSLEPRSRQLSPGFHFLEGEGKRGGIRVSYPFY